MKKPSEEIKPSVVAPPAVMPKHDFGKGFESFKYEFDDKGFDDKNFDFNSGFGDANFGSAEFNGDFGNTEWGFGGNPNEKKTEDKFDSTGFQF